MTNTRMLMAKIVEKGLTQGDLAEELGISRQALSYKLHNKLDFKASEIDKICNLLGILDKDACFFCSEDSQIG